MERGWTAATMLMDVGARVPRRRQPPYKPTNYDGKEYGPVSVRTALACSRNIPAYQRSIRSACPRCSTRRKSWGSTRLPGPITAFRSPWAAVK